MCSGTEFPPPPAYCPPVVRPQKISLQGFTVAYYDRMRLLLKACSSYSASQMFANVGAPTCIAVMQNVLHSMYRCVGYIKLQMTLFWL